MRYTYTSIDRIFSKLTRDLGSDFDETSVVEWAGEALEFIGAEKSYEEAVCFAEVKDHQTLIPKGLHNIIQIARHLTWTKTGTDDNTFCPNTVLSSISEDNPADNPPTIPVVIDCMGMPITDYDLAYYRPFFDLKFEYELWRNCSIYRLLFTPVRLATHSFFNSLVCTELTDFDNGLNVNNRLYTNEQDEYTIIQKKILRFSFKEGMVAIAYNRQSLDEETGYPLIPDHISYTTAITKYCTMKQFEREFYAGREGAQGKLQKAELDWQWYCKQAGNVDKMPYGIDEHQNLLEQRSYLIPRHNRYYNFFGNMARPEHRRFNDPDYRNRGNYLFRGNLY